VNVNKNDSRVIITEKIKIIERTIAKFFSDKKILSEEYIFRKMIIGKY
jgi:hypothetical protein